MKKTLIAVLVLTVFAAPAVLFAEDIEGVVKSVNAGSYQLTLIPTDKAQEMPSEVTLTVLKDADFEGINSLMDLKGGEVVKVEAEENQDTRAWEADKVELKANPNVLGNAADSQQQTDSASMTAPAPAGVQTGDTQQTSTY